MARVAHLTAHLGGGVGRALAGLIASAHARTTDRHQVLCLEAPEKDLFARAIEASGGEVLRAPSLAAIEAALDDADVVQLELWNHPATLATLAALDAIRPRRCVGYCHVSGLGTPTLPSALAAACHRFVLTSSCSLDAPFVRALSEEARARVSVVPSTGGFPPRTPARSVREGPLRVGYVGSQDRSKLHPAFVAIAASLGAKVCVRVLGDPVGRTRLEAECRAIGRPELLVFEGFRADVDAALAELDVLLYPLHPAHYGTNENALLEAMAAGVVPICWDNPAERVIVRDGATGWLVADVAGAARAFRTLDANRARLASMSLAATDDVRTRYAVDASADAFATLYEAVLREPPRAVDFRTLVGTDPASHFLACQGEPWRFAANGQVTLPDDDAERAPYLDATKGSVRHFAAWHPQDPRLARWAASVSGHA